MGIQLLRGDCRTKLKDLADRSVHCVVTSPPYFGLRDYGTAQWEGGDPQCDHGPRIMGNANKGAVREVLDGSKSTCYHCGARRIDSQIGLEQSPQEYVEQLVAVFREVRRVLRDDATAWLNLGDSYAGGGGFAPDAPVNVARREAIAAGLRNDGAFGIRERQHVRNIKGRGAFGLKPKDLIGIPWRVAFALQADGWYLRQDIIWAKPNPMPESVTDRCTKAHEYIFLLSKSARYYYDAEAIREPHSDSNVSRHEAIKAYGGTDGPQIKDLPSKGAERHPNGSWMRSGIPGVGTTFGGWSASGRNKRSVWEVATQPYSEAHFATFPPALIEPCIKAGTSEKGCCAKCGAPWVRMQERVGKNGQAVKVAASDRFAYSADGEAIMGDNAYTPDELIRGAFAAKSVVQKLDSGWSPSCQCNADVAPCTVLDPFGGAGTTGLVADRLGRNAVLIELNSQYADMAERRIIDDAPLFAQVAAK